MKNSVLLALFSLGVAATVPANAATGSFDFTSCTVSGGTACGTDLSAFGPVASTGSLTGVTATATALVIGSGDGTGISTTQDFSPANLGAYNSNSLTDPFGLGVCETTSQNNSRSDCYYPNNQVGNGPNTTISGSTNNNTSPTSIGTNDFEFILFQFSSAVDLSSIVLGNQGANGNTNPFDTTYFTSSSNDTLSQMEAALEQTTVGSLTGTGFAGTEAQQGCTTGAATSDLTHNSSCGVDHTGINEDLAGAGVTYLLIGASITDTPGTDYFQIQNVNITDVSQTPEPATFGLIGLALAGLGLLRRNRRVS